MRRWQETAIVLDLPSRPTSVRFNNARSTSLCASIYASVPNSFTFHVYVHAKHTVFEGIYSKGIYSFSFRVYFNFSLLIRITFFFIHIIVPIFSNRRVFIARKDGKGRGGRCSNRWTLPPCANYILMGFSHSSRGGRL